MYEQQKTHVCRLEVNLNALIFNLNYYKQKLPKNTKFIAMVKAFSYGSGDYEIAKTLQAQSVDYLGVAYADEGIELREKGITMPIIVMNSTPSDYDNLLKYKLEPEIYSLDTLRNFGEIASLHSTEKQNIHIKLDTGMHRLGFMEEEIPKMLAYLKNCENLCVKSIFSHLAVSDELHQDAFTEQQIALFDNWSKQIIDQLNYPILRHILNSSGIERFPNYGFDMVRLGLGLYGVNTTNTSVLKTVNTLKTRILQVKKIKQGETIGYCRNGKAGENTTIAILAIGYADGFLRKLGNGAYKVLVNGKFCPTIGNISMDMSAIDISGVSAKAGDEVIIFGDEHPVFDIAEKLQTITYEIFTNISARVKRVYILS